MKETARLGFSLVAGVALLAASARLPAQEPTQEQLAAFRAVGPALKKITQKDFGQDAVRWRQWWEENKATFSKPE